MKKKKIWFKSFRDKRNLKKAIKKANELWLRTGKKHHVISTGKITYGIYNRDNIKKYNRLAIKNNLPKMDFMRLNNEAVYTTPAGNTTERHF